MIVKTLMQEEHRLFEKQDLDFLRLKALGSVIITIPGARYTIGLLPF